MRGALSRPLQITFASKAHIEKQLFSHSRQCIHQQSGTVLFSRMNSIQRQERTVREQCRSRVDRQADFEWAQRQEWIWDCQRSKVISSMILVERGGRKDVQEPLISPHSSAHHAYMNVCKHTTGAALSADFAPNFSSKNRKSKTRTNPGNAWMARSTGSGIVARGGLIAAAAAVVFVRTWRAGATMSSLRMRAGKKVKSVQ